MYLLTNVYPEEALAPVSKHKQSTTIESGKKRKLYFIKRIEDYKCSWKKCRYVSGYI